MYFDYQDFYSWDSGKLIRYQDLDYGETFLGPSHPDIRGLTVPILCARENSAQFRLKKFARPNPSAAICRL